jgi:hypothetical protein
MSTEKPKAGPEPVKTYVAELPVRLFDIRARNHKQVRAELARIVREQASVRLASYDDGVTAGVMRRPIYDATAQPDEEALPAPTSLAPSLSDVLLEVVEGGRQANYD